MSELITKLSSYNIFNYLFPGILFMVFLNNFTNYTIPCNNVFILAFLSYFMGLVISRVGSVIIEPLFKKIKIIKFKEYKDFIEASKIDKKIEILSEQNNILRTMIALFLVVFLTKIYLYFFDNLGDWNFYILITVLCVLFFFGYRKQSKYISSRIEKALEKK